jgi:hypothetical protein
MRILKKSDTAILAYWGPTSQCYALPKSLSLSHYYALTHIKFQFFFKTTVHNGFLLISQLISCWLLLVPCYLACLENGLFESASCNHPFKSFVSTFHLNVKSMHFHFSSYVGDFVCTALTSQIQLVSTVTKDHYDCNGTCMRANDRYHCENHHKKKTPWSESANDLYRPSDCRLSAKWLPTFADRGCHVVSVTDPYGRILCFLDRSHYYSIK